MPSTAAAPVLTGRKVFVMFVLFFGTIASADAILVVSAVRTWSGVETASAYRAGQLYNDEIAQARAAAARGWRLRTGVERTEGASVRVLVEARDREGAALAGRLLRATLQRPTDRREDREAELTEKQAGSYEAWLQGLPPGQWDLVVDVLEGGDRVYRQKTRVVLP